MQNLEVRTPINPKKKKPINEMVSFGNRLESEQRDERKKGSWS